MFTVAADSAIDCLMVAALIECLDERRRVPLDVSVERYRTVDPVEDMAFRTARNLWRWRRIGNLSIAVGPRNRTIRGAGFKRDQPRDRATRRTHKGDLKTLHYSRAS